MTPQTRFDLPNPFCLDRTVIPSEIDAYDHVNNAVYIRWCDHTAWHHSAALGLPIERCLELDRGMAVVRTTIAYLRAAVVDDVVTVATWLLPAKSRLCVRRRFQIVRKSDRVTLARAEMEFACIELSSGRPTRWPPEFHKHYVSLPEVLAALPDLPAI